MYQAQVRRAAARTCTMALPGIQAAAMAATAAASGLQPTPYMNQDQSLQQSPRVAGISTSKKDGGPAPPADEQHAPAAAQPGPRAPASPTRKPC